MTRRQVMEAVKATEPQGTPLEYVEAVFARAGVTWTDVNVKWRHGSKPVWGALWANDKVTEGGYGFVSKLVVNDDRTFLSTDSKGRDRRIPATDKQFFYLPTVGG